MAEEDAELKELVIQSLESSGVLAKIRAQLRASVFLALDEANTLQKKKPLANNELHSYLSTINGQVVSGLFREFLQHFDLDSTLSVYESETQLGQSYSNRDTHLLCRDLGINVNEASKGPLIDAIVTKHLVQGSPTTGHSKLDKDAEAPSPTNTPALEEPKPVRPSSLTPFPTTTYSIEVEESDRDPFFDDPVPNETDSLPVKPLKVGSFISSREFEPKREEESRPTGQTAGPFAKFDEKRSVDSLDSTFTVSPLGSLKDAPPLLSSKSANKLPPLWSVGSTALSKSASIQDDDYEEDFQSSASIRSDQKSGTEHSIEEDIDENLSGIVDELLSNEGISEGDDATTDHTISHISTNAADYLESIG